MLIKRVMSGLVPQAPFVPSRYLADKPGVHILAITASEEPVLIAAASSSCACFISDGRVTATHEHH